MKLKIDASSLLQRHYLIVSDKGVQFYEGSGFSSVRRFKFNDILCVLRAPNNLLSFQVGQEIFTIQTKPGNAKHEAAIAALLQALRQETNMAMA